MAKMESMVPHILLWETGLKDSERGLPARKMYESVARRGYHNLPNDKGGPTMCGVTISTFAEWRRRQGKTIPTIGDLRGLKYDEWLAILKTLFWDPCMADKIQNASVAMMLVDWRWVNGTQAVRDAQNAFSLIQDGIVGQKTLAALNTPPPEEVFMRMKYAREASYRKIADRNPSQRVFLKGWISRTNSIEFRS